MKIAVVNWSDIKSEGSVGFTPEFEEAPYITKLDALQDAIYALQEKYDEVNKRGKI